MTEQLTGLVVKLVSSVRRNHALEHATLHILGRKYKDRVMGGYSDPSGFWIIGEITRKISRKLLTKGCKGCATGKPSWLYTPTAEPTMPCPE